MITNPMTASLLELAEYTAIAEIHECIACVEAEQQADNERQDSALSEPMVGSAIYEWKQVVGGQELRTFVPRQEWKTWWSFSLPATRFFFFFLKSKIYIAVLDRSPLAEYKQM
jgi:hypothetical protein